MSVSLIIALLLAGYIGFLMVRGHWSERAGLIAAVALGALLPQILAALSSLAGTAASQLTATGW